MEMPANVKEFVSKCADIVANNAREDFEGICTENVAERVSPIEQLFEAALRTLIQIEGEEFEDFLSSKGWDFRGVKIDPQCKIGGYRADYVLSRNEIDGPLDLHISRNVVVELDGHAFHDTDEKQRRYEKRRDRFMQKQGYKVFRFTGAEIVQDPFCAAIECMSFLTGRDEDSIREGLESYYG